MSYLHELGTTVGFWLDTSNVIEQSEAMWDGPSFSTYDHYSRCFSGLFNYMNLPPLPRFKRAVHLDPQILYHLICTLLQEVQVSLFLICRGHRLFESYSFNLSFWQMVALKPSFT